MQRMQSTRPSHRSAPISCRVRRARSPLLTRVAVIAALFSLPLLGCDANGEESGGEGVFDGAAPLSAPVEAAALGTGTKFTDLYTDFFGPGAQSKCAGTGACHGAATQAGAQASGGYVCPDDATTKEQCRMTMIQFIIVDPTSRASTCGKPFSQSYMYSVLRKSTPSGENNMPLSPAFVFDDAALARIDTWVEAGCPDN